MQISVCIKRIMLPFSYETGSVNLGQLIDILKEHKGSLRVVLTK